MEDGFWIPKLPPGFDSAWRAFNWPAQREYSSMQRRTPLLLPRP
jgi:hypothetical protein